eukprot:gene1459-1692_t
MDQVKPKIAIKQMGSKSASTTTTTDQWAISSANKEKDRAAALNKQETTTTTAPTTSTESSWILPAPKSSAGRKYKKGPAPAAKKKVVQERPNIDLVELEKDVAVGSIIRVSIEAVYDYQVDVKWHSFSSTVNITDLNSNCNLRTQKKGGHLILRVVAIADKQLTLCGHLLTVPQSTQALAVNTIINAWIIGILNEGTLLAWVTPSLIGKIQIPRTFKNRGYLKMAGSSIRCVISKLCTDTAELIAVDNDNKRASMDKSATKAGKVLLGTVKSIEETKMIISLQNGQLGQVRMIDASKLIRTQPFGAYKQGQLVMCKVLALEDRFVIVSVVHIDCRENPEFAVPPAIVRPIATVKDIVAGALLYAYVGEMTPLVARVQLSSRYGGLIQLRDVQPNVKPLLVPGKVVRVKVIEALKEGDTVCPVEIVNEAMLEDPVQTAPRQLRCPISVPELLKMQRENSWQERTNASYIEDQEEEESEIEEEVISKPKAVVVETPKVVVENKKETSKVVVETPKPVVEKKKEVAKVAEKKKEVVKKPVVEESESEEESEEEEEEEEMEVEEYDWRKALKWNAVDVQSTELKKAEMWSGESKEDKKRKLEEVAEEDMVDEEDIVDKKKQKQEKKMTRAEMEREVKEREDMLADNNAVPESANDFERVLLGSPNSSFIWIKYMSFYLGLSEIGKAKEIGERALKKIIQTDVLELRNIWIALYNIENMYGTKDTLLALFQKSILYQDPKTMYFSIIQILETAEKYDSVEDYFKLFFKKFKHSAKVWCRYGEFLLRANKIDLFRQVMTKSLVVLPKKKQIMVVSKYGQLEFKMGNEERGRTIFEGLVSSYPTRTDLWNVYLDMELKAANLKKIRSLFSRLVELKVSDRNIKQFFKRYLAFEKENGNVKTVEHVKELAMKFVEVGNAKSTTTTPATTTANDTKE